jgi:hypothetical protein
MDGRCALCNRGFETDAEMQYLPCDHTFHRQCMIDVNIEKCPICWSRMESNNKYWCFPFYVCFLWACIFVGLCLGLFLYGKFK